MAHERGDRDEIESEGPLMDLQTTTDQPTDGAEAEVEAKVRRSFTIVRLKVEDLNRAYAGTHLDAHVHVGRCVAGNGGAASEHYNASTATPPVINDQTEVLARLRDQPHGQGPDRGGGPVRDPTRRRHRRGHPRAAHPPDHRRGGPTFGLPAGAVLSGCR